MKYSKIIIAFVIFLFVATSCTRKTEFFTSFENTNDRIWIGKDFWSIPLEDWKVEDGKLYCIGDVPNSRVNILTHVITPELGEYEISAKITLIDKGKVPGSAGFLVGVVDEEDPDVRAACYFGKGIKAGVSLNGYAFLKDKKAKIPEGFDFKEFTIKITGNNTKLKMDVSDKNGIKLEKLICDGVGVSGLVAITNNFYLGETENQGKSHFCFDDIKLSGSKIIEKPENSFGPILWTMYTLSKKTVKFMALLPPIGKNDNQNVSLQFKEGENWKTVATEKY